MAYGLPRVQRQRWVCKTKSGSEFGIETTIGMGPQQAVEQAGFFMAEIDYIRPEHITVQEDMRVWREATP